MKNYSIISNEDYTKIVQKLIDNYGLPEIFQKFSIFSFSKNKEIHIHLTHGKVTMKLYEPQKYGTSELEFKNINIKRLFQILKELGFNLATMKSINCLKFNIENNRKVVISKETFLGNLIEFNSTEDCKQTYLQKILKKMNLKILDSSKLTEYTSKLKLEKEDIIDSFSCLNEKILKCSQSLGIDIYSPTTTLRNRLKKFSNDYSFLEETFQEITGCTINGKSKINNDKYFKPMTIVIPCYNSNNSILSVLQSIESQNISKDNLSHLQVILVDDGSKEPVSKIIKNKQNEFTFKLDLIRSENNIGLSSARNIGINLSMYEYILCIDSDIILSRNYILEHSIRLQLIPNSIFVSMKKNVETINIDDIKKGMPNSTDINDMRLRKFIKNNQTSIYENKENLIIELISDTNYFKNFGFGRNIGIFDLPSMVVGHNMSFKKSLFNIVGGFSNNFKGWGMEDSFFGAKAIALSNFIIPIISTNVYHINHPPRTGNEIEKQEQLQNNVNKYLELMDERFQNL